jgi:malonate-semialdehyde dehydrogenase (acetylating)/methylmalonate-semialdehyde dehydrogenase
MNAEVDPPPAENLVGNEWSFPEDIESQLVLNPSRGEMISAVPLSTSREVDQAVQAAAKAFPAWSRTPTPARAARLFAFKALLEEHFDELSSVITCENGKTSAAASKSSSLLAASPT